MKKGNVVTVYQDPITRQHVEGRAILVRNLGHSDAEMGERWEVKFMEDEDEGSFERWVK